MHILISEFFTAKSNLENLALPVIFFEHTMNKIPLKTIIQSHLSTEKMSYESPETVSTDKIE